MKFPAKILSAIPGAQLRQITLQGEEISVKVKAYKVDGHPSLHALADIGGYRICDHFLPMGDEMCVIEDAYLAEQQEKLRREFRDNAADKLLQRRYCLKAYGSIIVLYRLFLGHFPENGGHKQAGEMRAMRCRYWVVATDANFQNNRHIKVCQFLQSSLLRRLKPLFKEVEVMPKAKFEQKLRKFSRS